MGAAGSGRTPDPNSKSGQKRGQVSAVGTGIPSIPVDGLSPDIIREFENLVDITAGVTFEQDSEALLQLARLIVRQRVIDAALDEAMADKQTTENIAVVEKLTALSLALGRQKIVLWTKCGLEPKGRQAIIRPKPPDEDKPKSRFEQIRESNAEFTVRAPE